jgi:dTDP-4-amino-4,6-dideoxygalactose transaminase
LLLVLMFKSAWVNRKIRALEFFHDEPGFNYRMPNLNASLGCAQMEVLDVYIDSKRQLARRYQNFFSNSDVKFFEEPSYARSNYWLNAVLCADKDQRDDILKITNDSGVMTRPVWQLMNRLPMYENALRGDLRNSEYLEQRLLNLPSSPAN